MAMLGGALYSDGQGAAWLKVTGSSMSSNSGDIAGGSIYLTNGSLTLASSNVTNSTAGNSGGAVYVVRAMQVKVSRCRLSLNRASYGMGAAAHLISSRMDISSTVLRRNQVGVPWNRAFSSSLHSLQSAAACTAPVCC